MSYLQEGLLALGVGALLGWTALGAFAGVLWQGRKLRPAVRYALNVSLVTMSALIVLAPVCTWAWLRLESGTSVWYSQLLGSRELASSAAEVVLPGDTLWASVRHSPWWRGALSAVGSAWLLLALLRGVRLWSSWRDLRRTLTAARAAPPGCQPELKTEWDAGLEAELEELARQLRVPTPRLRVTANLRAPAVTGWRQPTILLPECFLSELSETDLHLALRHEVLHIARRDPLTAWLLALASIPLAGHPLLTRFTSKASADRELAVDRRIPFDDTASYAQLLLRAARMTNGEAGSASMSLAVPMASSDIRARLEQLTSPTADHASPWPLVTGTLVASAMLLGACAAGSEVDVADEPQQPELQQTNDAKREFQEEAAAFLAGRTQVAGRLHPDVIRTTMRSELGRFRDCYEQVPEQIEAKLALRFTIAADGTVRHSEVDAHELPEMGPCLDRAIRQVRFPEPEDGEVSVVYPIVVAPG